MSEPAEGILAKVQKLIDKAFSTTFEAEKQALLNKADALMTKYSIEQFMLLDSSRPNTAAQVKAATPELRTVWYLGSDDHNNMDSEVMNTLARLLYSLAEHHHVRIGYYGLHSSKVVGYSVDFDFLEMMFLSLKLHIISTISPSIDPERPWEDSLAALKGAGEKWQDIHYKLQAHPMYPYPGTWERKIGVRFTEVYRRWCEVNLDDQEQRVKANPKQWREGYIEGYVHEIRRRLQEMRRNSLAENPNLPDVLASKKNPINEMLWEHFPHLRPKTPEELAAEEAASASERRKPMRYKAPRQRYVSAAAYKAGARTAKSADLGATNGRIGG